MKIRFIKSQVDSLPFSKNKTTRVNYYDSQTPYLILRVSYAKKTFYYLRKYNQNQIKHKIGDYPSVNIKQAQDKVEQINKEILTGAYFNSTDISFKELFHKYYEIYSIKHKKSYIQDKRKFDKYLKPIHDKACNKITIDDIQDIQTIIGSDNGHYIANRVFALIRAVFNWGIKQRCISCINPTICITKFKEHSRSRFLDKDELKRFFEGLEAVNINETMRDYFKVLIFTGARKTNVMSMRWEDVKLENKIWTIPGEFYKNGEPFTVVLVDYVLEILEKRRSISEQSKYVFSSSNSKSGHLEEPKKAWNTILRSAHIDNLRIHDLRRTLGSWQAIGGSSLLVIGESLGQKSTQATEVYARLNKEIVRKSVTNATNEMLKVITETPIKEESETAALKRKINELNVSDIKELKRKIIEILM